MCRKDSSSTSRAEWITRKETLEKVHPRVLPSTCGMAFDAHASHIKCHKILPVHETRIKWKYLLSYAVRYKKKYIKIIEIYNDLNIENIICLAWK